MAAFSWDQDVLFLFIAGALQALFGLYFIIRRPRSEWGWLVGLLFFLNGAVSINAGLTRGWADVEAGVQAGALINAWIDQPTNLLIFYLAMVFPEPPAWGTRRPKTLRALVLAPFAIYAGLCVGAVASGEWDTIGLKSFVSGPWTLSRNAMASALFVVAMLRWAWLIGRIKDRLLGMQFVLIFGAIAVRFAHAVPAFELGHLLTLERRTSGHPYPMAVAFGGAFEALAVLGLVATIVLLILAALEPSRRRHAAVVLGFVGFGLLEAVQEFMAPKATTWNFWLAHAVVIQRQFDILVIRPIVFWVAMTRYRFLDLTLRSNWALPAFVGILLPLIAWKSASQVTGALGAFTDTGKIVVDLTIATIAGAVGATAMAVIDRKIIQKDIPPHAPSWEPGAMFDRRYRIEEVLHEGTATLYRALDMYTSKPVVLKRARADHAAREAHALRRARHPHTMPLLAIVPEGEESVLVLPFIEGETLEEHLGGGQTSPEAIHRMGRSLAAALAKAHSCALVHGNVHPSNILRPEAPILADFSHARGFRTPAGQPPRRSRFSAPEVHGEQQWTPASDVYGLGRCLQAALKQTRGAPAEMKAMLRKATDAKPANRHPDAHAFLQEWMRISVA